jgi:WD40 repeat protein
LSVSTLSPSRDELKTTHALALHGTKIVESSLGVRDLREPSVLHPMPKTGPVSSNAFAGSSPTGRFAYATADKKTLIWDLSRPEASPEDARPTTGGNTIPAAASTVGCDLVAISDDKRLAWYCEDDKLVLVVHPGRTRPTQIPIPEGTKLQSGRFSTRGRLLALLMLEDHTVPVYDSSSSSEKPVSRLVGHSGRIRGIDFSLDDRFVVTASDDSTARVWEVSTGSQTAIVTPLEVSPLIGASFSPDGLSVALASSNRLLAWRCYACGDISVLSDEVRRRKIDRTLSPAEENDYRITSAELALQASSRPAHSNQGHVARR